MYTDSKILRQPIIMLTNLLCYIRLLDLNQHCKDGLQKKNFLFNIVAQVLTSL